MGAHSALVVDDHELFRGGLKLLLQDLVGVTEIHEVGNFEGAYSAIADGFAPDLVTFDLSMPGLSGLEGPGAIIDSLPAARIVVVTASERRDDILGALGAGAHGYVPKSLPSAEIADAISQVLGGRIYAPSALQRAEKAPQAGIASGVWVHGAAAHRSRRPPDRRVHAQDRWGARTCRGYGEDSPRRDLPDSRRALARRGYCETEIARAARALSAAARSSPIGG
jgi:DNA-binding NarL/FixJ family response regulator